PSDIYLVDLLADTATQMTDALNPAIDRDDLVSSEIVRYESFDGLEIPATLYKPHGASAENPVPALVLVHGGPGGQTRQGYRAFVQHLVNHGYAILGANNRGSSGYGKTFYHLDDKRHGEDDLQDIVYGRKYLETLDWVDADKIGIIGGSYGGYMVAAALAFEPEAFDVGINIFGVTNWVRTLKSIPPWWEAFKESLYDELGDPATDEERLTRISPLFHADNIVRPLLVVQGANDPRVLKVESDELVAAVQANEVPVEYVVFPDEGHGFRRRENRITASEAYLQFLDTYLKGKD
ncbi:MAG: alpha/beta fold hydrolase, partial [Woeseiaceae bacterium]|nr:alpha/beta fold hydrolase [Woeseiaceae bacterium]